MAAYSIQTHFMIRYKLVQASASILVIFMIPCPFPAFKSTQQHLDFPVF